MPPFILSLCRHASAADTAALRLRWYDMAFATSFAFVLLSLSSPLLMLPPQPALSRQRLLSPSLSSILLLLCHRGLNLLLASPTAACLCSQVGVLVALIAPVCCGARALMFCSSQLHDAIPLNPRCPTVHHREASPLALLLPNAPSAQLFFPQRKAQARKSMPLHRSSFSSFICPRRLFSSCVF